MKQKKNSEANTTKSSTLNQKSPLQSKNSEKTKARFKTQFNPTYKGTPQPEKIGKSMTVPDMSMSIRELYKNQVRQTVNANDAQYFEDEIIPNFQDLTDEAEYRQEKIKEIEETLDKAQRETEEAIEKKATEK